MWHQMKVRNGAEGGACHAEFGHRLFKNTVDRVLSQMRYKSTFVSLWSSVHGFQSCYTLFFSCAPLKWGLAISVLKQKRALFLSSLPRNQRPQNWLNFRYFPFPFKYFWTRRFLSLTHILANVLPGEKGLAMPTSKRHHDQRGSLALSAQILSHRAKGMFTAAQNKPAVLLTISLLRSTWPTSFPG